MAAKWFKFQGNIWVLDNYKPYRRETTRYLDLVKTTEVGKTLFGFINGCKFPLAIAPFHPTKKDPVNAYASPLSSTEADAYPKDYILTLRIRDADGNPIRLPDGSPIDLPYGVGTGKGSETVIDFHPATWREKMKRSGRIAPGAGPGETLFHEMVHAFRMMTGNLHGEREVVVGAEGYDNTEEFNAILAANVYRSERGFTSLRKDHWEWDKLDKSLSESDAFYKAYTTQIRDWFKQQQLFCVAVATAPARFNPFRSAAVDLNLMTKDAAAKLIAKGGGTTP